MLKYPETSNRGKLLSFSGLKEQRNKTVLTKLVRMWRKESLSRPAVLLQDQDRELTS
jgi:hypothetical protein